MNIFVISFKLEVFLKKFDVANTLSDTKIYVNTQAFNFEVIK